MTGRHAVVSLGFVISVVAGERSVADAPLVYPALPARFDVTLPPAATSPGSAPSYTRKGRRDPFQPLETSQGIGLTVASARLKGILRGDSTRALVETPDGIGYIMKPGDTLGEGRLVEIGSDSVVFQVPPRRGSTNDRLVLRLPSD